LQAATGYVRQVTNDNPVATEGVDVLVIGGGQAGLAMSYHLAQRGLSFVIAEANPEVGHMWRSRWQSLKLFTAGQYNNLPGMRFPADPDTYPGRDDVANFLQAYAEKFELPVRLNTSVTRLSRVDGRYRAETTTGPMEADQVVVATGPFQVPFTPRVANELDPAVTQLHSAAYQAPDDLPEGRVLVVGAANSGQQIALELAQASRDVDISVGQRLPTLPQRWLGRDLWWWLTTLRIASVPVSSRLGQRLSQRDVVIGGGLRELRRHGVGARPRVTGASGHTITFEGGESADYDGVVWATGFRIDHSWVDIPEVKDERGQVQHVRGVTASPGLYLLGMTWQHTRTSALLGWVGIDATYLADRIEAGKQSPTGAPELAATTS
jgi:putative flavoprotein involved in K+ transport